MSRLFIDLYLDEDVSVLIAELIRARGFSVTTTLETQNLGNSDQEQLEFAIVNKQTLLTHNRVDFEALAQSYFSSARLHHGIIIAVRRPPHAVVARLLAVLNSRTKDEIQNQLLYI